MLVLSDIACRKETETQLRLTIGSADHPLDSIFAGWVAATAGFFLTTATRTLTLSGINHHTGGTTIVPSTLQLGADHALGSGSLTMSGGALALTADALFDFGSGASALTFADRSALTWTGTLTLFHYTLGNDTLSFSSATGLTSNQLTLFNSPATPPPA